MTPTDAGEHPISLVSHLDWYPAFALLSLGPVNARQTVRLKKLTEHRRRQSIPRVLVEDLAIRVGAEFEAVVGRLVPRRV